MKYDFSAENFLFSYGLSIQTRTIYINDSDENNNINITNSSMFIKAMDILERISNSDITVVINSSGGDILCSFAIYDRMMLSKCKINTIGYGSIFSGASIIMQAGTTRKISKNSRLMIHNGTITLNIDANKFKSWCNFNESISDIMYNVYYINMKKANKNITIKDVSELCDKELYLDWIEAKRLGLITDVLKGMQ